MMIAGIFLSWSAALLSISWSRWHQAVIIWGNGGHGSSDFFNVTLHFITVFFLFIKLNALSAPGVVAMHRFLAMDLPELGRLHPPQLSPEEARVDS